jgi:acyl carrier protein
MSTVTADAVEARVKEVLVELGADADQVTRDAKLEELDIDSLDLVELGQVVEDEYHVRVAAEDVKELKTVGDAVNMVVSRANA